MKDLTPQQIVHELDKYIIGQNKAKRAVAVALRNRYRRSLLPREVQAEITPKNILMIGPTGVGKTEIARRLAKLADAPFIKVEATKFTEVGYVGRDAESIIRDLMETAINMIHEEKLAEVRDKAEGLAVERILNYLCKAPARMSASGALPQATPAIGKGEKVSVSSTASAASAVTPPKARRESAKSKAQRQRLAELLAAKELEEQMIEIELESEDSFPSVLEFVTGINTEEVVDNIQEFVSALPSTKKRSRQVSVKEARRLLTQEEANKLIDFDGLVEQATQRVEQSGVIFLDELDKIANSKNDTGGPDVSGEGVQRDLLPIVEGSVVMSRYGPVKTDHILWIAAGAFYVSKPTDLIPELQGRFPLRVEMSSLTQEDFKRILVEPENALTRQYQSLLHTEEVSLEFTPDGIEAIADNACLMNERMENIGARRLHTIIEKVLEDVSFNASEMKGQQVVVDGSYVQERLAEFIKNEDLSKYIL